MPVRDTVTILGTPIDRITMRGAMERIEEFVAQGGFHQVATANTDFLVNALQDPELCDILNSAALVSADGMPLVWAARLLRSRLPERVTGVDLTPRIAEMAAAHGWGVFLLGARQDVARRAAQSLLAAHPGLRVVGCASPEVCDEWGESDPSSAHVIAQIQESKPQILLVAFGNPKQEKWIWRYRAELAEVPVCIGVGATFDFLAGDVKRAPRWMQRSGLEWLHRLCQDPTRLWRRYCRDLRVFGFHIVRDAVILRIAPAHRRADTVRE